MSLRRDFVRSVGIVFVAGPTVGCLTGSERPYELFVSNATDQELAVDIALLDDTAAFVTKSFDVPTEGNWKYEWTGQVPDEIRIEWLDQTATKQVAVEGGTSLDAIKVMIRADEVAVTADSR